MVREVWNGGPSVGGGGNGRYKFTKGGVGGGGSVCGRRLGDKMGQNLQVWTRMGDREDSIEGVPTNTSLSGQKIELLVVGLHVVIGSRLGFLFPLLILLWTPRVQFRARRKNMILLGEWVREIIWGTIDN